MSSSSSSASSASSASLAGAAPSSSSSQAQRRGIRLVRETQTRFVTNAVDGFRFTVTASDAYDMPNEIFAYVRRPLNPTLGTEADEFSHVCSVPDLEEYPAAEPTGTPPFFRLSTIDLVFRSQTDAEEAWELIQREVTVLVDTLNRNDVLSTTHDVQIGG